MNVFQPGYEFNGRIIRAAIVSVADPETVNAE
jgi:molecular chaperone GrpE (heat shock protein)